MILANAALPDQLAALMTRIYEARLTTPSGGNLSVLDPDGSLWVTPTQIDKGLLRGGDMMRILADGTAQGRHRPTSEWPFHRAILAARPDCRAVVHAHCVSLVAYSVTGQALALDQFPDLCRWTNRVAFSGYAIPGSAMLGEILGRTFAEGCDATLMENHGAVAAGADLLQAFHRLESLELLAAIKLGAARLGGALPLPAAEMDLARRRLTAAWTPLEHLPGAEEARQREELLGFVQRAHRRGLLASMAGAMSLRCGDGFLITPDGLDKSLLTPDDLVFVQDGAAQAGQCPDSTAALHAAVYADRPHVGSLATALPPALMAFAASGREFDARTIPEAYIFLKTVPSLPFAARFDPAPLVRALDLRTPMALIENGCAVVTGATPFAVFDRLEVAEFTACSILDSLALGPLKPMSEAVLEEICRVYNV